MKPNPSNSRANVYIIIGTRIIPIAWLRRIPIRGGIRPIAVPMIRTPKPIHPVDNQTSIEMNPVTVKTTVRRGTISCIFSIPLPTLIITGTANSPEAIVIPNSLMKSAGGSTAFHISIGYIMLRARAAPERGLPTM